MHCEVFIFVFTFPLSEVKPAYNLEASLLTIVFNVTVMKILNGHVQYFHHCLDCTYSIRAASVVMRADDAVRPVEIVAAVGDGGIAPLAEVCGTAAGTHVIAPSTSHVVDDGIYVDPEHIQ